MSAKPTMKKIIWTLLLPLTLTGLVACGGGGGGSTAGGVAGPSGPTSGVAVDPYIEGAMFQEIAADGVTVLQRQSTASDALGRFSFPLPTTVGSTIMMKAGAKGVHQGAPYEGILKRKVTTAGDAALVVSPMTTVLANGSSEADLLSELQRAGFSGLTAADLTADPLAALPADPAAVSDANLKALQANLALNAVMAARNNYDLSATDLRGTDTALLFHSLALGVRETLNSALCRDLATAVAAAPQYDSSKGPLAVNDVIATAVQLQRNLIAVAKESLAAYGGRLDPVAVENAIFQALQQAPATALEKYLQSNPPGGTPAPAPAPGIDAQALFSAQCGGCHSLNSSSNVMNLSGDGAKLAAKFTGASHMGNSLSSAELTALANLFNGTAPAPTPTPTPTPVRPTSGSDLYRVECQTCHGLLATSNIKTRTAAAINSAIANNIGGMGSIVLTSAEANSIAAALPTTPTPTPTPTPNGQTLYNSLCAVCHKLGSVDPSGFAPELGGKGTLIGTKLAAGHQNLSVTTAETTAIGSFADANAPAPAPTPTPVPTPTPGPDYSNCTACHGQPPIGASFPNTKGAHAVHAALPSVGNNCQICHSGASHNNNVELVFPAAYNAKSGAARDNGNGTCSNISCHGGKTTPDWWSGSIAVDTQCAACHASGTAQFNSYNSGRHSLHNNRGYACTVCHSTTKLAGSHFGGLNTSALNSAAAGIGGSGTRVTSYTVSGSTKTCATSCHGNERW